MVEIQKFPALEFLKKREEEFDQIYTDGLKRCKKWQKEAKKNFKKERASEIIRRLKEEQKKVDLNYKKLKSEIKLARYKEVEKIVYSDDFAIRIDDLCWLIEDNNGDELVIKELKEIMKKQGIEYPKPSNKREIILKKVKKEDVVYDN